VRRPAAHERHGLPDFRVEEILAGLARDEFEPYFQAKVVVESGRVLKAAGR